MAGKDKAQRSIVAGTTAALFALLLALQSSACDPFGNFSEQADSLIFRESEAIESPGTLLLEGRFTHLQVGGSSSGGPVGYAIRLAEDAPALNPLDSQLSKLEGDVVIFDYLKREPCVAEHVAGRVQLKQIYTEEGDEFLLLVIVLGEDGLRDFSFYDSDCQVARPPILASPRSYSVAQNGHLLLGADGKLWVVSSGNPQGFVSLSSVRDYWFDGNTLVILQEDGTLSELPSREKELTTKATGVSAFYLAEWDELYQQGEDLVFARNGEKSRIGDSCLAEPQSQSSLPLLVESPCGSSEHYLVGLEGFYPEMETRLSRVPLSNKDLHHSGRAWSRDWTYEIFQASTESAELRRKWNEASQRGFPWQEPEQLLPPGKIRVARVPRLPDPPYFDLSAAEEQGLDWVHEIENSYCEYNYCWQTQENGLLRFFSLETDWETGELREQEVARDLVGASLSNFCGGFLLLKWEEGRPFPVTPLRPNKSVGNLYCRSFQQLPGQGDLLLAEGVALPNQNSLTPFGYSLARLLSAAQRHPNGGRQGPHFQSILTRVEDGVGVLREFHSSNSRLPLGPELAQQVLPRSVAPLWLSLGYAYLKPGNELWVSLPELGEEVFLRSGVSSYHNLAWPTEGLLYVVDQGSEAGIYLAKFR